MAFNKIKAVNGVLRVLFFLRLIIETLRISHDQHLIYTQINRAYNKLNKIHYF